MNKEEIAEYLKLGAEARLSSDIENIFNIGLVLSKSLVNGGKILIMGNGGSAADAQHIAAELVGRFEKERKPLFAMALHSNTSSMTAIANDYGYEYVYQRQVEAFAKPNDIVIGISTSGNSKNIILAMKKAKELGCITIGMTGTSKGLIDGVSDYVFKSNTNRTSMIQEVHIAVGHIWSKMIEDLL
ncbi:MAG: D-sedoheptulose-7-phosphate isomerase [Candidatus Micrarchaeia archaeon]